MPHNHCHTHSGHTYTHTRPHTHPHLRIVAARCSGGPSVANDAAAANQGEQDTTNNEENEAKVPGLQVVIITAIIIKRRVVVVVTVRRTHRRCRGAHTIAAVCADVAVLPAAYSASQTVPARRRRRAPSVQGDQSTASWLLAWAGTYPQHPPADDAHEVQSSNDAHGSIHSPSPLHDWEDSLGRQCGSSPRSHQLASNSTKEGTYNRGPFAGEWQCHKLQLLCTYPQAALPTHAHLLLILETSVGCDTRQQQHTHTTSPTHVPCTHVNIRAHGRVVGCEPSARALLVLTLTVGALAIPAMATA